jgi:cell division protein FtsB
MKRAWLNLILVMALFWMSFSLLSSKGGWGERLFLENRLAEIEQEIVAQEAVNAVLEAHLASLYSSHHAIETVARYRLGMIKENENFIQFLIERPQPIADTPFAIPAIDQPIESPLPFNPIED